MADEKNRTIETTKVTKEPSQSTSWRDLPRQAQERLEEQQRQTRATYGAGDNGNISRDESKSEPILGFNLAEYRKKEEDKAEAERLKAKAAGWRNALALISDMVTAGMGGNVYKRDKDDSAAKAQAKQEEIGTRLRGMGVAYNDAITKKEQALRNELQQNEQKAYAMYGRNNTQQVGGTTTTEHSTQYGEGDPRVIAAKARETSATAYAGAGGRGSGMGTTTHKVKINTSATDSKTFDVDKSIADTFARSAIGYVVDKYITLNQKLNHTMQDDREMDRLRNYLSSIGISTKSIDEGKSVYLTNAVVQNFLSNGNYDIYKENADLMKYLEGMYAESQGGQLFYEDPSQKKVEVPKSPWSLIGQQQAGGAPQAGGGGTTTLSGGYIPKDMQQNKSKGKQSILISQN